MVVYIPLSRGATSVIDDIDADLANFKWCLANRYAVRGCRGRQIALHRIILARILERELQPGEVCDHRNGNGLDNHRSNLRVCTQSQNSKNQKMRVTNTSGYRGVWIDKSESEPRKWYACIKVNRKSIHLGRFNTPEEAAAAYESAAEHYFGEWKHAS